jgi:dihydrofolate reductase
MRKVLFGVGMSLDGYIARPDGSIDFLFMPKDYSMAKFFARMDVAVMGRKSFEVGLKLGGGKFDSMGMEVYVFSRTLKPGLHSGAQIVADDPKKFVADLKKKKGKDIWLMGGGELNRELLMADLVDELHLGILPVVLGEGIAAFPAGFPQRDFLLIENKTYAKGMIGLQYARKKRSK